MSKKNLNKSNLNVTPQGDVVVDYFTWMDDPKMRETKDKLNYLAALMEHYRQIEFIDQYKNAGFENMDSAVHWMLGQGEYEDKIMEYRLLTQNLLRLLATPKVMDAIRESCHYFSGDTAEMLDNMLDFFIKIDAAPYRTMLEFHSLLHNPTDKAEEIEKLTIEYEERIRSACTGKVQNHY